MKRGTRQLYLLASASMLVTSAMAIETRFSGFAQVTVGRVVGGSPTGRDPRDPDYYWGGTPTPYPLWGSGNTTQDDFNCPCYVASYEYTGVYEHKKTQLGPETLGGVQADISFTEDFSATVQAVARGSAGKAGIDWAFGTYKISPQLSVQFGRKRLPLYYYSDFMYVGYAYPWIRPPQDLYAWQIYSYDGANLMYKTSFGGWSIAANGWLGSQRDKDNALLGDLYYGSRIDEQWKKMTGLSVEGSNDIVTVRGIYMKTTVAREKLIGGKWGLVMSQQDGTLINDVGQDFYGVAINADYENWLWRSEINYINRPTVKDSYTAMAYSIGRQFNDAHTVMFTWSDMTERAPGRTNFAEKHSTMSVSYRWDLAPSQAIKVQYDHIKDRSDWLFTGTARLLAASWNFVF